MDVARIARPTRRLLLFMSTLAAGLVLRRREGRADPPPAQKPPPDQAIWKHDYDKKRIWGYADRHSVAPGEPFNIMLSTGPGAEKIKGRIEIFRVGHYGDGGRKLVWKSDPVTVERQEVQETAAALGAGWPPAFYDIETEKWPSGYYSVDFVDEADERDSDVTYVVVTNPRRSGDVLVVLSTNTWHAYNAWGGYSFYESAFLGDRAQMISFDRPSSPAFFEYEDYLVRWLEKIAAENRFQIDYATNFDVHRDPASVDRYRLFISGSHNEYWSKQEFDALYRRIFKLGKNTLFLGANAAYWQIRYADVNRAADGPDHGRQLICFKSLDDPIRQRVGEKEGDLLATARFRDGARRPETMLTGSAYQSYFAMRSETDPKYPYVVARTDLPFFQGTGYTKGQSIGDIVGYEWDNTDPDGDGRRLLDPKTSQIAPLDPAAIKVLFTGTPVDVDGRQGKAEAVYFVSKAGAKVFNAGSIRWAWGLGKPGFESEQFRTFNRNLVLYFLKSH
jgi:hypothetical protein